jgi:hypothetical protein
MAAGMGHAAESNLEDFSYSESFEGGTDPVALWTSNGKYTINSKGITTEKAHQGKSCYKLDVTFDTCTYIYWSIPLNLPAEGQLKATAYYLLGNENTADVSIGARLDLLPPYSGYVLGSGNRSNSTKGDWAVAERTDFLGSFRDKKYLSEYLAKYYWEVNGDNVTPCIKGMGILTYGKKGTRAVIYIDDVNVSGRVMNKDAFTKEINRRWLPVQTRNSAKFKEWEEALSQCRAGLASMKEDTEADAKSKSLYSQKLDSAQRQFAAARKTWWLSPAVVKNLDEAIKSLKAN